MTIVDNREDGGKLIFQTSVSYWSKMGESLLTTEWKKLPEQEKEAYRSIWYEITAPYHTLLREMNERYTGLFAEFTSLMNKNASLALTLEQEREMYSNMHGY